jgi:capsular polysaccharide biosynthesis protein
LAVHGRLTRVLTLLRPRSIEALRFRIEARRRLIEWLQGSRPQGVSAHALELGPSGPVRERTLVLPGLATADQAWEDRWLHALSPALVDDRTGLVMIDGRVVHESGGVAKDKRPQAHKRLVSRYLAGVARGGDRAVVRYDRPVHHLGEVPRGNYYHWLIETLPRVLLVADRIEDVIVLHPEVPTFAIDALRILGIENRICESPVRAETLIVVDPPLPNRPHPFEIDRLRIAGIQALETAGRRPVGGGVYVSRRKDSRALLHEERLEQHLKELGFTIFDPQSHPRWIDQLALFAEAEIVVGPHGAGLANTAFVPEGARVIELSPDAYASDMFGAICRARGVDYLSIRLPIEPGGARFGSAQTALRLLGPLLRG